MRTNSYDTLCLEWTLAFHNVIILIKSVFNRNQNQYSYNIFLENGSYQAADNGNRYYIHFFRINVYLIHE